MTVRRIRTVAAGLALALAFAGCGKAPPRLVPCEGVVKINGKPAANIMVQFLPDTRDGNTGPTSTATTDAEGKFRLVGPEGKPGAVVGKHMVMLVDNEEERPAQGQPLRKKPRLDPKFAAPLTSNLTAEVKEGGGPVTVEASGPP